MKQTILGDCRGTLLLCRMLPLADNRQPAFCLARTHHSNFCHHNMLTFISNFYTTSSPQFTGSCIRDIETPNLSPHFFPFTTQTVICQCDTGDKEEFRTLITSAVEQHSRSYAQSFSLHVRWKDDNTEAQRTVRIFSLSSTLSAFLQRKNSRYTMTTRHQDGPCLTSWLRY